MPTIAESGLPGFEATAWNGLLAPAGTPDPVIARFAADVQAILADPAVRADFARQGTEPMPTTPAQFADIIARDIAKWRRVVRDAGITPD